MDTVRREAIVQRKLLHLFSAEPDKAPIYSDRTTLVEKYTRALHLFKALLFLMSVLTLGMGIAFTLSVPHGTMTPFVQR